MAILENTMSFIAMKILETPDPADYFIDTMLGAHSQITRGPSNLDDSSMVGSKQS